MYHKKYFVLTAFLMLILLAACAKPAQPADPTLTFGDNTCTYSGPNSVPFGDIKLNVVLPKKDPLASGFVLATLQSGKTIADLKAWSYADINHPTWVIGQDDQGDLLHDSSYTYQLPKMYLYHPYDSLYLICFQMNSKGDINKIGAFGPIEVTK